MSRKVRRRWALPTKRKKRRRTHRREEAASLDDFAPCEGFARSEVHGGGGAVKEMDESRCEGEENRACPLAPDPERVQLSARNEQQRDLLHIIQRQLRPRRAHTWK